LRSHKRAHDAAVNGRFDKEIVPIEGHDETGAFKLIENDEVIREDATLEALDGNRGFFFSNCGWCISDVVDVRRKS